MQLEQAIRNKSGLLSHLYRTVIGDVHVIVPAGFYLVILYESDMLCLQRSYQY